MKYTATQTPPEWTNAPDVFDDEYFNDISVFGYRHFRRLSPEALQAIEESEDYESAYWMNVEELRELLTEMTGRTWKTEHIHGYAQSDWAELVYPADIYQDSDIELFECEFFNLGTEYKIENDYEEIYFYAHGQSIEEQRKEIAECLAVSVEDVTIYTFEGFRKEPIYKLAQNIKA